MSNTFIYLDSASRVGYTVQFGEGPDMSEIKRRWEQLLLDADPDYQRWLDDLDRQTQEFQEQQEQQREQQESSEVGVGDVDV